jgi:hypothetical protein
MVAIALTVTSTGIASMLMVLFLFLWTPSKRKLIILIAVFATIVSIVFIIIFWDILIKLFLFIQIKYEEFLQLFIKIITLSNEKTQSGSFGVREKQISDFFENLQPIHIPFGYGISAMYELKTMIENLFIGIFHDYGVIGFSFMILIIFRGFVVGIKSYLLKKDVMQLMAILSFVLYGMTLEILAVFNSSSVFMILFYFSFWCTNRNTAKLKH